MRSTSPIIAILLSATAVQATSAQEIKNTHLGFPEAIIELLYNRANGRAAVDNISGKMTSGEKSSFLVLISTQN